MPSQLFTSQIYVNVNITRTGSCLNPLICDVHTFCWSVYNGQYLTPKVFWRMVPIPHTKNEMLRIRDLTSGSSFVQMTAVISKGIDITPPILVTICWIKYKMILHIYCHTWVCFENQGFIGGVYFGDSCRIIWPNTHEFFFLNWYLVFVCLLSCSAEPVPVDRVRLM